MRTPLAVIVTGSLLVPSVVPAQVVGTAVPAARPGASAFILTMPSLSERQHYLADRVDGWHTMIREGSPLAHEFLPEMAELKRSLAAVKDPQELTVWSYVVDAFETRLMERLDPRLPQMAPQEREAARQAILEQKDALVALNRRRLGADRRTRVQIDALKKQIKAAGLEGASLAQLYDRAGSLTHGAFNPASASLGAPQALAAAETVVPGAFRSGSGSGSAMTDWSYPRPAISQRATGSMPVPEPGTGGNWAPGGPMTMDEQQVVAKARAAGLNAAIVDQAFREAKAQGVDFRMVLAVIQAESAFNPHATSGVGARGLMQIMPGTGRGLGVHNSNMLYDVATNIKAGVRYLKGLWDQFSDIAWSELASINPFSRADVKAAIAAYNAGPGAVQKYGGVPPYRETRGYVVTVLQNYSKFVRTFG